MKYRGIFEYEYPTKHKPPISIDVHLHGDCVKGKIIEWEYRPLEQEPILDKINADIQKLRGCSCSCSDGIIDDVEDILDKYKAETETAE